MKTDRILKLIQQKNVMRSGGALPLPKAQKGLPPIEVSDPNDPRLKAYQDSSNVYNDFIRLKNMADAKYGSNEDYYIERENYPKNPDGSICYNCIKKEAERKKAEGQFYTEGYNQGFTQLVDPNINPQGYINYLKDNLITDESVAKFNDYSNAKPKQPVVYNPRTTSQKKNVVEPDSLDLYREAKGRWQPPVEGIMNYDDVLKYKAYEKEPDKYGVYGSRQMPIPPKSQKIQPVGYQNAGGFTWNVIYPKPADIPLMKKKGMPESDVEIIPQSVTVPVHSTQPTTYMDMRGEWSDTPPTAYPYTPEQLRKMGYRQGGGPTMNPYMPGVPMATGAVESTMGPVEMLLLPSQLPIRAATALGRGAVLAAEALNPISGLKPTPGMMYRGIGKEGFEDAMKSGVLRPQQHGYAPGRSIREIISSPKQFGSTYFTPNVNIAKQYGKTHVAATPQTEEFIRRYGRKDWSWFIGRQLPLNEVELYKKNLVGAWRKTKQDGGQENLEYVPSPGSTYGNYYDPSTGEYIPQVYLKDVDIVADKYQGGSTVRDMSKPYLNPAVVQATLASANQPITTTTGRVVSTPESREKERREKIVAKDPSKYSVEDYKKGIQEPATEYVPIESLLLPGTPAIKGLGKVGNFVLDAFNPVSGMRGLKPKSFKSEINWGNWNKEIPENKALMREYNAIEQQAKANGTWMKNPDGSTYQGTPEQFVQENSENFKKAFPEGYDKTYRGSQFLTPKLDRTAFQDKNIITFGTSNESVAKRYATNHPVNFNREYQDVGKDVPYWHPDYDVEKVYGRGERSSAKPGVYELIYPKGKKTINAEGQGNRWYNIKQDEVFEDIVNNNYIDFQRADYREYFNPSSPASKIFTDRSFGNVATDDMAQYMIKNNIPVGKISNVYDGVDYVGNPTPSDVTMLNTSVIPVKSRWYNNGMFDMTNPNIYKSVIPAAIGLKALQQSLQQPEQQKQKAGGLTKAQEGLQYVLNGTYGNYYDPNTQQYIPQVYLPDVEISASKDLPFQNNKFAPFLAARGTADYVPIESMLLPGTPVIKGLSKATNFAIDALNPLAGMRGLKSAPKTPFKWEQIPLDDPRWRTNIDDLDDNLDLDLDDDLFADLAATVDRMEKDKLRDRVKGLIQNDRADEKAFNDELTQLRTRLQFGNPKLEKPLYDPNLTRSIQDNLAEDALLRSWWQKEQMLRDPLSQTTTVQGQPFTFSPRAFESKRKMQDFSNPFGGKEAWRIGISPNKLGGLTKHQSKGVVMNPFTNTPIATGEATSVMGPVEMALFGSAKSLPQSIAALIRMMNQPGDIRSIDDITLKALAADPASKYFKSEYEKSLKYNKKTGGLTKAQGRKIKIKKRK